MASRDERPAFTFSFLIHELEEGPKTYDEPIERAFVEGALEGEEDFHAGEGTGKLHVMLTKMGKEILANGTVKTSFVTQRSRGKRVQSPLQKRRMKPSPMTLTPPNLSTMKKD